jgi:hypothetical protein
MNSNHKITVKEIRVAEAIGVAMRFVVVPWPEMNRHFGRLLSRLVTGRMSPLHYR